MGGWLAKHYFAPPSAESKTGHWRGPAQEATAPSAPSAPPNDGTAGGGGGVLMAGLAPIAAPDAATEGCQLASIVLPLSVRLPRT